MINPITKFREKKGYSKKDLVEVVKQSLPLNKFMPYQNLEAVEKKSNKITLSTILTAIKGISLAFPEDVDDKEMVKKYCRWYKEKYEEELFSKK